MRNGVKSIGVKSTRETKTDADNRQFPVDALGTIFGGAARALHEVVQADVAICGQSILFGLSSAVQGMANVEVDGRTYPLADFFITVADSGERKSATDEEALSEHKTYQEKKYAEYKKAKKAFEDKKDCTTNIVEPVDPRFIRQDVTYEALVKRFEFCPSIALSIDEGGVMIGGHALNKENALKTIAGLCKVWGGQEIDKDRKVDGNTDTLYGRRLGMHMLVQPKVFHKFYTGELTDNQGFFSRCLVIFPKKRKPAVYNSVNLKTEPRMKKYRDTINSALLRGLKYDEAESRNLVFRTITLDTDAKTRWIEIHNQMEVERESGKYTAINDLAAKAPEHIIRLAGNLALGENLDATTLTKNNIENAFELITYYLEERAAYIQHLRSSNLDNFEDEILNWLDEKGLEEFNSATFANKGPNKLRKKEVYGPILANMVAGGKLQLVDGKQNTWAKAS